MEGQEGYMADTQPPGRPAAACVPATHSAKQRKKGDSKREWSQWEQLPRWWNPCYVPPSTRQLSYEASAESQPMARTSSAAAGPTSVTFQKWTRARPLSMMSVRHSTESEWRGMRAVLWYWSVSCTLQQQQRRRALERQNSSLSIV